MATIDLNRDSSADLATRGNGNKPRALATWGAAAAVAALPLIVLNAATGAANPISGRFLFGRVAGLASACCLLIAAVGLLAWPRVLGTFGGAGAGLAAIVGTGLAVGLRWADAFVVPFLAHVAPSSLGGATGALGDGIVVSNSAFAIGWLVVGLAAWNAHHLPRWMSGILVATSLLALMPTHLDPGHVKHLPTLYDEPVPLAAAIAAIGAWLLWRQRHGQESSTSRSRSGPRVPLSHSRGGIG